MISKNERELLEERIMKNDPSAVQVLLSKERTLLSKERTSISLAQLGVGIAAFGFLVLRFFVDGQYDWFLGVGVIFIAVSVVVFWHAYKDYRHYRTQLNKLHNKRGHLDVVYIEELED